VNDTMSCPECGSELPASASFCTHCGHRMEAAATPPPPAPSEAPGPDVTQVVSPGLGDATQVLPPAPPAPEPSGPTFAPPPSDPTPSATPWEPASGAGVPSGPPTTAPWNPPPNPPAPAWEQPVPPSATGSAPGTPAWATSPSPSAWTAAPAEAARSAGSPLGGLAAVAGGALTLVGIFSGWITMKVSGGSETVSGWKLTTGDAAIKTSDAYVLLGLGIAAVLVGVVLFLGVSRPIARVAAIGIGVAIVVTCALDWKAISDFVKDTDNGFGSDDTVKTAIGFYLAIAGGALSAVAAFLPSKK
jgi:hypothetical protein